MQLALLQLDQSPDFQRAATFAKQAKSVPAAFRIRQFRRFRQQMVEHLAARLRQGMSAEELLPGLPNSLRRWAWPSTRPTTSAARRKADSGQQRHNHNLVMPVGFVNCKWNTSNELAPFAA